MFSTIFDNGITATINRPTVLLLVTKPYLRHNPARFIGQYEYSYMAPHSLFHPRQSRLGDLRGIWMLCFTMITVGFSAAADAQSQGLQGYWRGSGHISPRKGKSERVRCRVWISSNSAESFNVKARCASQSANIDQTGRVRRMGRNRFLGDFYNSDYDIRGRISITLRGNQQTVTMSSDAGSGRLRLFRR